MTNTKWFVATTLVVAIAVIAAAGMVQAAPAQTKVDINAATAEQLTELPGVGETLAARIVEYRESSGGFQSPEELMNVKGIGEKSFLKLRDHVSVGAASGKERR